MEAGSTDVIPIHVYAPGWGWQQVFLDSPKQAEGVLRDFRLSWAHRGIPYFFTAKFKGDSRTRIVVAASGSVEKNEVLESIADQFGREPFHVERHSCRVPGGRYRR